MHFYSDNYLANIDWPPLDQLITIYIYIYIYKTYTLITKALHDGNTDSVPAGMLTH
jgi:hypothetical protein